MNVLRATALHRTYPGDPPVHALRGLDLTVRAGERLAVVGPSGSGKSTLLNIIGLLDTPTDGRYEILGRDTAHLSAADRDRIRASDLGFVFQDAHVLGSRTVAENLEIRLAIHGTPHKDRPGLVDAALAAVDLVHRRGALGRLLSGGERQRLAIARAVITRPALLLADEPTGNLDPANASRVLDQFDRQTADGVAVVVITHDARIAAWADRSVTLVDGRLETVGVAA